MVILVCQIQRGDVITIAASQADADTVPEANLTRGRDEDQTWFPRRSVGNERMER